jgi:hypothetical protein
MEMAGVCAAPPSLTNAFEESVKTRGSACGLDTRGTMELARQPFIGAPTHFLRFWGKEVPIEDVRGDESLRKDDLLHAGEPVHASLSGSLEAANVSV